MPSLNVPTDIDGADGYDEFSPNFPLTAAERALEAAIDRYQEEQAEAFNEFTEGLIEKPECETDAF
jgi:hypothetical protein